MCGDGFNINPNIKSDKYYINDRIIDECLKIYNHSISLFASEVSFCHELFLSIYNFYVEHHEEYIRKSERISCLLTYKDMKLLDMVGGENRSEKIRNLLHYYYDK